MGVKTNYTSKVWLIYLVTLADLIFNGIADHNLLSASDKVLPTVWVGCVLADLQPYRTHFHVLIAPSCSVQFFIQLLNLTFFTMLLFDTYLFQVGLVGVLVQEFRGLLLGLGAYAVVYTSYAAVKLHLLYDQHKSEDDMWSLPLFQAFSILQKLCALAYYVLVLYYSAKLGESVCCHARRWLLVEWAARLSPPRPPQQSARARDTIPAASLSGITCSLCVCPVRPARARAPYPPPLPHPHPITHAGEPQWYQRHHWVARYSGIAPQAGTAGPDAKR